MDFVSYWLLCARRGVAAATCTHTGTKPWSRNSGRVSTCNHVNFAACARRVVWA
jgi:hypothetical protein